MRFEDAQLRQIELGVQDGLDVSTYAKPELDWTRMREIRRPMEKNNV